MEVKPEQLERSLQQDSFPLYWVSGDEPLLRQEAADQIRAHYHQQGYRERELLQVDAAFDWNTFSQSHSNLSLFAEARIIELRLAESKLEESGKQALQRYCADPTADIVVLMSSPRLDKRTLTTKWFKAIIDHGVLVQVWPINREGLPAWLQRRLLQEGIQADTEALEILCDRVEGNLLAARQEIEKLKLLADAEDGARLQLDANTVLNAVADNARYNAFQLVDTALLGDGAKALKMLTGLQSEGVFPLAVLGAITRELRSLLPLLEKKERGQGSNAIMQSARVWPARRRAVGAALNRLHSSQVWAMLDRARRADHAVKGLSRRNPWDEIASLVVLLSGQQAPELSAPARR